MEIVPFSALPKNEKKWGVEHVIVNESGYAGKAMVLKKGFQCSIHRHINKDEAFFVTQGSMIIELWEGEKCSQIPAAATDSIRIPPGTWHRFKAPDQDCTFFEFSTHDDPADNERRTQSGPIKG